MTVCNLCKGTGKLLKPWYDTTGAMTGMTGDICFMCDGKGTIGEPMTNEEYLKTCTTEQLAEWMASVVQKAISIKENNGIVMLESAIWWEEWLKQPHTAK